MGLRGPQSLRTASPKPHVAVSFIVCEKNAREEGKTTTRRRTRTTRKGVDSYDEYSVGLFIHPICSRGCFNIENMVQVCGNFRSAQVFIMITGPDDITASTPAQSEWSN